MDKKVLGAGGALLGLHLSSRPSQAAPAGPDMPLLAHAVCGRPVQGWQVYIDGTVDRTVPDTASQTAYSRGRYTLADAVCGLFRWGT